MATRRSTRGKQALDNKQQGDISEPTTIDAENKDEQHDKQQRRRGSLSSTPRSSKRLKSQSESPASSSSHQHAEEFDLTAEDDGDAAADAQDYEDEDVVDPDSGKLSYEEQRAANIRRNAEQMRLLQIPVLVPSLSRSTNNNLHGVKRQRQRNLFKERREHVPARRSLRNQGLDPEGNAAEIKEGEGRYVPSMTTTTYDRWQRKEGVLDMQDVKVIYMSRRGKEEIEEEKEELEEETKGTEEQLGTAKEEKKEEKQIDQEISNICQAFASLSTLPIGTASSSMKVSIRSPSSVISPITPTRIAGARFLGKTAKFSRSRITSLQYHPGSTTEGRSILLSGDKIGQMNILITDQSTQHLDDIPEDQLQQICFHPHTASIHQFCFTGNSTETAYTLYTCSNDGSIRSFDFHRQQFLESYVNPEEECITSMAVSSSTPDTLYASDRKGYLITLDTRSHDLQERQRVSLSRVKVGSLDLHPLHAHMLVSGSNDRTVKIWDLRYMKDQQPIHSFEHGRSVTCAYFSPSGNRLLSTSYDNYVRLWEFTSGQVANPSQWSLPIKIHHNNHTGQWVTLFRAKWTMTDDAFTIGNMGRSGEPRQVDVYQVTAIDKVKGKGGVSNEQAQSLSSPVEHGLTDPVLTAVSAVTAIHPTNSIIAGATGSSYGYIWTL